MAIQYGDNEYIRLFRKMVNWEWYTDVNTKVLFLHCLLRANWKPGSWKGIPYERGQFITSLNSLATETGLSIKMVRTALNHLIMTKEVTSEGQGKGKAQYRIITVLNYDAYQATGKQMASEGQDTGKAGANKGQQYKNIKEDKEIKNNNSRFVAPSVEEVREYCRERNNSIDADEFVNFYQANGWVQGKGKPIKDWKACVRTWENNRKQNNIVKNKAQDFPQRTYTDDEYHEMEMRKLRKG